MAFFSFLFGITNPNIYSVMNDDYEEMCELAEQLRGVAMLQGKNDEQGDDKQRLCRGLADSLLAKAEANFENEEGLMRNYAYPALRQHIMDHLVLIRTIENLRIDWRIGTPIAPGSVSMLKDWLERHVDGADKELATFLSAYEDMRSRKRKDLSALSRHSLSLAFSVNDTVSQDVVWANRLACAAHGARCESRGQNRNTNRADKSIDANLRRIQDRIWYE